MFANLFNSEEKENFLELVYKIATCDGEYAAEEEELVNNYKIELSINNIPETKSISELIEYFSHKETPLKKVVFFELYGMIMADSYIADNESKILDYLKEKFTLNEKEYLKMITAANELQRAYDLVYDAVFN